MGDNNKGAKDDLNVLEEIRSFGDYIIQHIPDENVEEPHERVAEESSADLRGIKRCIEWEEYQAHSKKLRTDTHVKGEKIYTNERVFKKHEEEISVKKNGSAESSSSIQYIRNEIAIKRVYKEPSSESRSTESTETEESDLQPAPSVGRRLKSAVLAPVPRGDGLLNNPEQVSTLCEPCAEPSKQKEYVEPDRWPTDHSELDEPHAESPKEKKFFKPSRWPMDHNESGEPYAESPRQKKYFKPSWWPRDHNESGEPYAESPRQKKYFKPSWWPRDHNESGEPYAESARQKKYFKPSWWHRDDNESGEPYAVPARQRKYFKPSWWHRDDNESGEPYAESPRQKKYFKPSWWHRDHNESGESYAESPRQKKYFKPSWWHRDHNESGKPYAESARHKKYCKPSWWHRDHNESGEPYAESARQKKYFKPSWWHRDHNESGEPYAESPRQKKYFKPSWWHRDHNESGEPYPESSKQKKFFKSSRWPTDHDVSDEPYAESSKQKKFFKSSWWPMDHDESGDPYAKSSTQKKFFKPSRWPMDYNVSGEPYTESFKRKKFFRPGRWPMDHDESAEPYAESFRQKKFFKASRWPRYQNESGEPYGKSFKQKKFLKPSRWPTDHHESETFCTPKTPKRHYKSHSWSDEAEIFGVEYTKPVHLEHDRRSLGWFDGDEISDDEWAVEKSRRSNTKEHIKVTEDNILEEEFQEELNNSDEYIEEDLSNSEMNSSSSDAESHSNSGKRPAKKHIKELRGSKHADPQFMHSRSRKSKYYDDYMRKLNYLLHDARFFVMKSSCVENITLSKAKGVWSTLPQNEVKLNEAFHENSNVFLIFSIKGSGRFAGFARLNCESKWDVLPVSWMLPPQIPAESLGGVFKIDWLCRKSLLFVETNHLCNPWNDDKPVRISRDGQEIEPHVGKKLCRLFPIDEGIDLTAILHKSKIPRRRHRSSHSRHRYIEQEEREFDTYGHSHSFGRATWGHVEPDSRKHAKKARGLSPGSSKKKERRDRHPQHYQQENEEVDDSVEPQYPRYYDGAPLPEYYPSMRTHNRHKYLCDQLAEDSSSKTAEGKHMSDEDHHEKKATH
ncbi:uncharacterized protein LOC126299334 isoform X2 [Schistocerca gregaria]|uniref:uncharacterized protein LOC126299334 isoform X2 n=1 Tax=Schistocerca gregaria TaxID=7010 RepID=UPI00211EEF2D|nr:uncharacterized protein LOC126299334 isoform X2 [Schistocerca gregaria]